MGNADCFSQPPLYDAVAEDPRCVSRDGFFHSQLTRQCNQKFYERKNWPKMRVSISHRHTPVADLNAGL